jgi:hypothetical protein
MSEKDTELSSNEATPRKNSANIELPERVQPNVS